MGEATVGDVLLMVSELATNALRYAGETFEIRIMISGHDLRVEVADSSAGVPQAQWVSAGATSGRGLAIVESLSDGWGVTAERGGGKAVWFELRAAGG